MSNGRSHAADSIFKKLNQRVSVSRDQISEKSLPVINTDEMGSSADLGEHKRESQTDAAFSPMHNQQKRDWGYQSRFY